MGTTQLVVTLHIYILLLLMLCAKGQVNSASPQFSADTYPAFCLEGTVPDSVLLIVTATDTDSGPAGQIDYSIEENKWFRINQTGAIKVKGIIDAEGQDVDTTMTYIVTATDRGTPSRSATATVRIAIGDENEFRPRFDSSLYIGILYDGDPAGTFVTQVKATDKDRDSVLTYDLAIPFPYLHIDNHTGNITVRQTVDYDDILASQGRDNFQVRVRVNDTKFLEITTLVIRVERKNHIPPKFDLTSPTIEVSVDEGVEGVVLETVKATDDQGYRKQVVTYGLLQQAIPDYLNIGPRSGVITLVKSLDRESIPGGKLEQLITAKDDGNPQPVLTSTATLIITVNDVNDNSPVYSEPSFQLALPQTYQAGQQYTVPTATDADLGENARVVYQLSPEAELYFSVDRDSSVLTTRADCGAECIKTEDCSLGRVTIYAFNEGLPLLNDSLKVELILTTPGSAGTPSSGLISCADASTPNNNDPVFQPPSYVAQVSENSPVNTSVLIVSATDADVGNSGNLTFSVNSPDFGVNTDGTVYTLREFDYEQLPTDKRLCVDVVATDQGRPPRSSTAEVCVTVVNVNDNPPSFPSATYQATVRDGDPADTEVITLTADDVDGTDNMTYELLGTNPYFKIHPTTGLVSLAQTMDRVDILTGITGEIVEIGVRVNDGPFSAETSLQVTIESSNRYSPVFTEGVVNKQVPEESTGTILFLSASDQDVPAQTIRYQIANQTYNGIFSIDPSSGEFSVVSAIDRENLPSALVPGTASVLVRAVDNGTPQPKTGTATVNIEITDVNDNKPQFAENYFEVRLSEDFTPGQVIKLPDAADADLGENARIVYAVSPEVLARFSAVTNTLTTTTTCDKSCVKTVDCALLQFSLEAYNPDKPQERAQLPVYVTLLKTGSTRPLSAEPQNLPNCSSVGSPNNNDPKFTKDNYEGTVDEGVPPNTVVLIVNTTDEDWGDSGKVTYTITNSTRFGIDNDGQIYTTGDLDYEKPEDRRTCMQVVATDGGTPARSASTVVCVDVLNQNDNSPVFTTGVFSASVSDGDAPGVFLTQIKATDLDAESVIRYDFASPSNYFRIDATSGNVTVSTTINRADILTTNPNSQVDITVRASDGDRSTTAILRVTVFATNKFPPTFTQTVYTSDVDEGISGTQVIQVSASDDDNPQEAITYSIHNSTLPNIFTIDPSSGQVRLVQALDREALSQGFVEAVIVARDSGNPAPQRTATATLRLQINDLNDNVPQFDKDSHDLNIFQNFTSGQSFALPKATDKDVSDTIVYELSDNAKQFFTLDPTSGVVTTRTDCDASCKKLDDCNYITFNLLAYNPGARQQYDTLSVRLTLLAMTDTRTPPNDVKPCSDTNSPNDHDPKFTKDNYEGTVDEGVPPNTVVLTVNTTDDDWGDSGKVTYTITNSTRFGIDNDGQIYTTGDLDYEKPEDRRTCMQVVATDGGTPPRSASTIVCVDLINTNDHRPQFVRSLFTAVIDDGALPGTFVARISATDKDPDSQITYDFSIPNDYFRIDAASGNVTVSKTIVRSEITRDFPSAIIIVQVRANDSKYLEITQLRVTVQEVNHFSPEFNQTVYNAAVNEGISNVVVSQVTANDKDVPKQQITYSIYNSTMPNIFTIDPSSGQVRLVQALDREALPVGFVEAVIMARDSGNPAPQRTATATLRLQVNDLNDNVPQFNKDSHDLDIFQNFTSGQSFALPKATDKDASDTIVYELSDNAKQFFTLDPTSGMVTTRTDCDASCKKLTDCNYMTFTLWAYNPDAQDKRGSLTVRLTLLALTNTRTPATDIKSCSDTNSPNDHDPKFTKDNYEGTVDEGVPPNTVVLIVNTTDEDWGDSGKVTYTITNSTRFGIDDDGQIYTTGDLDYEKPEDRRTCMQVVATDGGTPPRSASTIVCVDLINTNDHRPQFVRSLFTAVIDDGALPGTFVARISATDKDPDSQITYDFSIPNDYFRIDAASGNVTVSKTIVRSEITRDFPSAIIIVQVRANDSKYLEITQLRVTVQEVNHFSPEFNQTVYNAAVNEGISNVVVSQVTANDKDVPKQQITYSIYNSTMPNIFTIDPSSGQVRLVQALDREALPVGFVEAVIMARDSGNPAPQRTATATLRLQVNDLNDNVPQFNKDSHDLDIFQNFTSGQSFALPKATDKDASDTIVYELSDNAKQFFTLDPTSGMVTTRTDCDASCKKLTDCNYMTFTLWAYNPDVQDKRGSLTVRLTLLALTNTRTPATDIKSCSDTNSPNDHDPKFTKDNYEGTVDEGVPPNTVVLTVNTTDEDWGDSGKVTYTITNSTRFGIDDDGQIYTTGDLDYEKPEDRRTCMQVVATDGGTPPRSASTIVCVDLINTNDHRPQFVRSLFTAVIDDGALPGTFVARISATDKDPDSQITYDFSIPNDYFRIDAASGNVTVSKTIVRSEITRDFPSAIIIVQVRANDSKYLEITQLRVTVQEVNHFSPEFNQTVYNASVDEGISNVVVSQVTANDKDVPKQQITYSIYNSTMPNIFTIDPSSGQVRLVQALDREALPVGFVEAVIMARDSGNPAPQRTATATLRLQVNDLNDNVPQFDKDSHDLDIFQNFTSGQSFALPKATDKDASDTIVYELSDNAKQFFTLDPTSGMVTTRTDCDASCKKLTDCNYMTFTLWAYNPDAQDKRGSLTVRLTLLALTNTRTPATDIKSCSDTNSPNDHDPKFTKDNYEGTVDEGVPPNTVVLTVNTTDEDWGDSGKVTYTITNSTRFGIDDDGQIYTTGDLDYEKPEDRRTCMQVVATDGGTPPRSASTIVCVDLINTNDHRPQFVRSLFTAVINDGALPGTFVARISATDKDPDSQITYDFSIPNDYFRIDAASGNVTVSKTIVRSEITRDFPSAIIIVQVRANDSKYLEITQLRVTVQEVNHFSPEFNQTVYNASVDEGISNVVVSQVTANDKDVPKQQITYSIYNSTMPNIFTIDPSSGQVRLVQALDREALPVGFVEAVIMARDSGNPAPQRTATATLRLQVNDLNDNVPQFDKDSHDLDIFQNFTSGQSFALPKATDKDASDTIVYELSDNAKQFFTLDPTSGMVTTRTDCDASCKKLTDCNYMTFTLWAYNPDAQDKRGSLTVRLTLLALTNTRTPATDIKSCSDTNSPNDHDPKFTKDNYEGTVDEGVPPNTVVLTVNTTDEDWGDSGKVTYTITNSTRFGIDDDGQIYTTGDLDYEKPEDRRTCMQVVATDGGTPPRSASTVVCVNLLNQNEHRPTFSRSTFSASVLDRSAPGTFVIQILATDADSGATVRHSLVPVTSEYFQIDAISGNITVKKTINRDAVLQSLGADSVVLTIRATDGVLESTAQVRVTIVKKNDFAPEFGREVFPVTVVEETLVNPLITVTATDRDSTNEIITYRIVNITSLVSIDSSTGVIRLDQTIDRESLASDGIVDILVEAKDSGRPPPYRSATATVRITVTDVNDNAPTFHPSTYDLQLYQNFSRGDTYIIPTASDPDTDSTVVYTLDPADPWFEVDPNTGQLRVREDCGQSCAKIQDCYYGEVTVWASNPDKPNIRTSLQVRVTMLTTATTDKIDSQPLPSCSDAKAPNKFDPTFSKPTYFTNVTENSDGGTVVFTVSASDPDWGDSGKVDYTITNSTDFGVNEDGQIIVKTPPDYESSSGTRICIQVVARDRGTPVRSASTVVCIDVTNVNDNDPVFEDSYAATVYDGENVGKFVVKITARDADPGTHITYGLETHNPYFRVDANSGNVTVATRVDREDIIAKWNGPELSLRVSASDSEKTGTTQLLINVLSLNEKAPRFTTDHYEASVDEETVSTVPVLTVQAVDDDIPRQPVDYFLQPSNYSDHFEINRASGAITLVQSIDRESLNSDTIKLIVVAVDGGNPPPRRSSSATVLIRVNDINDNAPYFDPNVAEIRMMQNFTAGIAHKLPRARDADVGINAQVGYWLSEGASRYFRLDSNTTTLTTHRSCANCLRNEDYKWTVITVTAYNLYRKDLTSQLQVTVYLLTPGNYTSEPRVEEVVFTERIVVNRNRVKVLDTVFATEQVTGKPGANYTIDSDNNKVSMLESVLHNWINVTATVAQPISTLSQNNDPKPPINAVATLTVFSVTESGDITLAQMPPLTTKTYTMKIRAVSTEGSRQNMIVNLLVTFVDDPYLDEKGIIAISVICAIALLIIILVVVHIIWWKTRHKKDKDQVMMGEDVPRGCCCGKPLIAVPVVTFNGESSL